MESSMSRLMIHSSLLPSFVAGLELSLLAFRPLWTILAMRCRKGYVMSLVGVRRNGVRSGVGFGQCKFRHREGSMPGHISLQDRIAKLALQLTLIAEYNALAISLSCSKRGLLPNISGSQNWPTAPFMCPIFPWAGGGAFTHCDGSRPTPHTM